jgi:PAS domain S-box-containing protein
MNREIAATEPVVSKSIMIVEDEALVALDLRNRLQRAGYRVPAMATTAEQAISSAQTFRPDLILMDIRLKGDLSGIEAAKSIRASVDVPVVFLTAHSDADTLRAAQEASPFGYITKPFGEIDFRSQIETACLRHRAESALLLSRQLVASMIMGLPDAVIATDLNDDILLMNPAAEQITGYAQTEVLGRKLGDVLLFRDENFDLKVPSPVFGAQHRDSASLPLKGRYRACRKSGTTVVLEIAANMMTVGDTIAGVVLEIREPASSQNWLTMNAGVVY